MQVTCLRGVRTLAFCKCTYISNDNISEPAERRVTTQEKMMEKIRILLAAAESTPFAKVGDLGSLIGSLSSHLHASGVDIRIILPLYKIIREEKKARLSKIAELTIPGQEGETKSALYRAKKNGITFYFVENDQYYDRPWLYEYMEEDGSWSDFNDNLERFSFFSRSVLEAIPATGFTPHIIHCFSWHTALIPSYLKIFYKKTPPFNSIQTLFTVPNIAFQGSSRRKIPHYRPSAPLLLHGFL